VLSGLRIDDIEIGEGSAAYEGSQKIAVFSAIGEGGSFWKFSLQVIETE